MLAALAVFFLIIWLVSFVAYHVSFMAIHLLLVFALILFVLHFLGRRGATA